jgi:hypothetical protein
MTTQSANLITFRYIDEIAGMVPASKHSPTKRPGRDR